MRVSAAFLAELGEAGETPPWLVPVKKHQTFRASYATKGGPSWPTPTKFSEETKPAYTYDKTQSQAHLASG